MTGTTNNTPHAAQAKLIIATVDQNSKPEEGIFPPETETIISILKDHAAKDTVVGVEVSGNFNVSDFFAEIKKFPNLKKLTLSNNDFQINTDLKCVCEYLESNPSLEQLTLRYGALLNSILTKETNNLEVLFSQFASGKYAKQLSDSLKNNTYLTSFNYGPVDEQYGSGRCSETISSKLIDNNKLSLAIQELNTYQVQADQNKIGDILTPKQLENAINGLKDIVNSNGEVPQNIVALQREVMRINSIYNLAIQNQNFSSSEQASNINKILTHYTYHIGLINAIRAIHQQSLNASKHDESILKTLCINITQEYSALLKNPDSTCQPMLELCREAQGKVQDKDTSALIKNALLILSAILTFGISLCIYAAVTQDPRVGKNSFFYQDNKPSARAIDEVMQVFQNQKEKIPSR